MEILAGMALLAFLEVLAWLAYRTWQKAATPPPLAPRSQAQRRNKAAFDAVVATTPVVRSLRLQRRVTRGARRRIMESRGNSFEE
jgi:hypothetical protein